MHTPTNLQVGTLISVLLMSQHSKVAHGIVAHMLTRPDAYRYPTVMEHALSSLIVVQYPTQQLLAALMTLVRGMEKMEQDELAILRAAVDLNATKALDFALNVSGILFHQNVLKSSAVMILAGLINRGRMVSDEGTISGDDVVSATGLVYGVS